MNAPESQMQWRHQVAEMDVILSSEGLHPEYRRSVMEQREQKLTAIRAIETELINSKYNPINTPEKERQPYNYAEWLEQQRQINKGIAQ